MKTGTKSVLFGAHCPLIHPWFVAWAWWQIYRWAPALDGGTWPGILDPRLWIAFVIHDLGYWGKAMMDDAEGERHPLWAAAAMRKLPGCRSPWARFVLLHSRHYAKRLGRPYSRLCVADKLAIALEPWWLYLPRAIASGEIREYFDQATTPQGRRARIDTSSRRAWFRTVSEYCARWAWEHADGRHDRWTTTREADA